MKIFFLEKDEILLKDIIKYLNSTRITFEIKVVHNEDEVLQNIQYLTEASVIVLNLNDPCNPNIMNILREEGAFAPILLILEKNFNPLKLKTLYYLSYNDIIIKKFSAEEMAFRIYKLCDIWNDNIFFLNKTVYFDFKKFIFYYNDLHIHLGKKEALLLKLLFIKSPSIISFDEISYYIYSNDVVTPERIRSLIRQIRKKIPIPIIETVKGEGYKIIKLK